MEYLQALSDWSVATHLRQSTVAYPLVNASHILSIGLLIGAIATLDLRVLGLFRHSPIDALAPPLSQMAAAGLALALITGFLLFSVRPAGYIENPAFLIKITLVAAGTANALLLRTTRYWHAILRGGERHPLVTLSVCLSLTIWLSAIFAGRWIGFLQ